MLNLINQWWIKKLSCKCGAKTNIKYSLYGEPVCKKCALKAIGLVGAVRNQHGNIRFQRGQYDV